MTITSANETAALALDPAAQDLLFRQARTANTFSGEPVPDEQLRAVYDLVKYAPTSANVQPLRIVFVRTEQAKARLVPLLFEGNRDKTAAAPVTAILAADTDFHEFIPRVFPMRPEFKEVFAADEARRHEQARFNATLQAAYFIIGVRAAGLAAGPMGGYDGEGIDREFFPDGRHRTVLVVNIGTPGENPWFDRLPRLDAEDVLTWL